MSPGASRAVRLLLRVEAAVTGAAVALACGLLAAAALVGFWQVIARFVLSEPAVWSETLVRTLLIWMAYLGVAGAVRMGSLVSVDLLYRTLKGRAQRTLEALVTAATLALLIVLFWYGWDLAWRVRFQNLAGLEIPMSFAYAAVPVGALVSCLSVVAHFFDPRRQELEAAV